ncbi:MAG TPA: sugar phosphate nucleotidyltransferase [Candidatus Methylacidiphilales bacterium]|nr:sugar phosphate nucleotidyltransferase [Candidatus Methylacidiphilales bacterium]
MITAFDTIILAGGVGSRLRSVVSDRPKCLATINGRPFLSYLLDRLARAGANEVILSTGYMAEQVEGAFGHQHGPLALRYSREETPLGTGGGAKQALPLCKHDYVLIINGDSFFDFDWLDFFAWFEPATMRLGMVLARIENSRRYGQVIADADGKVLRFQEKNEAAGPGWINAGVYLTEKSALAGFSSDGPFSLERDFFPAQIGHGFFARGYQGRFIDIGTPESYAAAGEFFAVMNPP